MRLTKIDNGKRVWDLDNPEVNPSSWTEDKRKVLLATALTIELGFQFHPPTNTFSKGSLHLVVDLKDDTFSCLVVVRGVWCHTDDFESIWDVIREHWVQYA